MLSFDLFSPLVKRFTKIWLCFKVDFVRRASELLPFWWCTLHHSSFNRPGRRVIQQLRLSLSQVFSQCPISSCTVTVLDLVPNAMFSSPKVMFHRGCFDEFFIFHFEFHSDKNSQADTWTLLPPKLTSCPSAMGVNALFVFFEPQQLEVAFLLIAQPSSTVPLTSVDFLSVMAVTVSI